MQSYKMENGKSTDSLEVREPLSIDMSYLMHFHDVYTEYKPNDTYNKRFLNYTFTCEPEYSHHSLQSPKKSEISLNLNKCGPKNKYSDQLKTYLKKANKIGKKLLRCSIEAGNVDLCDYEKIVYEYIENVKEHLINKLNELKLTEPTDEHNEEELIEEHSSIVSSDTEKLVDDDADKTDNECKVDEFDDDKEMEIDILDAFSTKSLSDIDILEIKEDNIKTTNNSDEEVYNLEVDDLNGDLLIDEIHDNLRPSSLVENDYPNDYKFKIVYQLKHVEFIYIDDIELNLDEENIKKNKVEEMYCNTYEEIIAEHQLQEEIKEKFANKEEATQGEGDEEKQLYLKLDSESESEVSNISVYL